MQTNNLVTIVDDLKAEGEELYRILETMSVDDWKVETTFKGWTPFDVITHLHMSDHMALTTIKSPEAFKQIMRKMRSSGLNSKDFGRSWIGQCDAETLLEKWSATLNELCEKFLALDPEQRITWAGPSMRPRMFITARQMETWAHGQEIFDFLRADREPTERLKNIAEIGVRTFGWSFSNRQLSIPSTIPFISLKAPNGKTWEWNEDNNPNKITGSALDFCQVVTQVRNIRDTALKVEGGIAKTWMAIAQCFAGPPEDPPAPGSRLP